MESDIAVEMWVDFADLYGLRRDGDKRVAVLVDGTLIDPDIPDHIGAVLRSSTTEDAA